MSLLDQLVLTRDGEVGKVTSVDSGGWHFLDDGIERQYRQEELMPLNADSGNEALIAMARKFGLDELRSNAVPRLIWQRKHCSAHRAKDTIMHQGMKIVISSVEENGYAWTLNGVKQAQPLTDQAIGLFLQTGELPGYPSVPELQTRVSELLKQVKQFREEVEKAKRDALAASMREDRIREQLKAAQDEQRQKKQRDEELNALKKRVADLEGFWLAHRNEKPAVVEPEASRIAVRSNVTEGELERMLSTGYEVVTLQFYGIEGKPMLGGVFKRSTTVKVPELVPVESEAAA